MAAARPLSRQWVSRRWAVLAGVAALGGGAAFWRSGGAPDGCGPSPRRLNWNDLRPAAAELAEVAALQARIEARRQGELGLPAEDAAPETYQSMAAVGLGGVRAHPGPRSADWVDGAALDTSPAADAPFSWRSEALLTKADLVLELDGAFIALPGYVVPLDFENGGTRTFLLAPFVGACIHVPPPPPNQIVLVTSETPYPFQRMFEAVAVTGLMRAEPATSRLAEVGYQIEASRIEPFDPEVDGPAWRMTG